MRQARVLAASGFLLGLLPVLTGSAEGQEAQASLSARLELIPVGAIEPEALPSADMPLHLRVTLTDGATGQPPRGLDLLGWVRPQARDGIGCTDVARALRATRTPPVGTVDLNGVLIVTLNRDGSVGVIDPKLNLQTSNMIAAATFDPAPQSLALDPVRMRALLAVLETGRIEALSLTTGDATTLAEGLDRPNNIAVGANGDVWVAGGDGTLTRLDPLGAFISRIDLGTAPSHLRTTLDPEDPYIGAFSEAGRAVLVDGTTGGVLMDVSAGGRLTDIAFSSSDAIVLLPEGSDHATIVYAGDEGRRIPVPLGRDFDRITMGPDARIALAWTPGEAAFVLIDLASNQAVQAAALDDATVSEVRFTDNAAFLLSHDGGYLGAIDLTTVSLGKPAVLRRVDLGARTQQPEKPGLLVPLFPSPQIMAVEPENQTGWIVSEIASSVEMPPMDSTRLRGGVPRQVRVVDRRFREVAPGVFETVWSFAAGPHEMILTTGIGGLTACLPFRIAGEAEAVADLPLSLRVTPPPMGFVAGRPQRVVLRLLTDNGAELPLPELTLAVPSMTSSWKTTVTARRGADGRLGADLILPHAGTYVLQPLRLPRTMPLRAAAVIVVSADRE